VILLDTNVISELVRVEPDPAILAYVSALAAETVFTAAVCEAEIRYGLARMPAGRQTWLPWQCRVDDDMSIPHVGDMEFYSVDVGQ
jgi:toxin FitB